MTRHFVFIVMLLLMQSGNSDCRHRPPVSPRVGADTTYGYVNLINDLRTAGAEVESAGEVSQPFFSVKGTIIKVNNDNAQVFEYANASAANKEVLEISADGGSIGTSRPSWIAPPHFYKKGKILVLYLGDSAAMVKVLESALGRQFAGK